MNCEFTIHNSHSLPLDLNLNLDLNLSLILPSEMYRQYHVSVQREQGDQCKDPHHDPRSERFPVPRSYKCSSKEEKNAADESVFENLIDKVPVSRPVKLAQNESHEQERGEPQKEALLRCHQHGLVPLNAE